MRFYRSVTTAIAAILLLSAATGSAQEHFDVVSIKPVRSAPNGLRLSQDAGRIPKMLQRLLTQPFRLRAHLAEKPARGYALRVRPASASILKPTNAPEGRGPLFTKDGFEADGSTMEKFCSLLTFMMKAPVVDETGLKGTYTFRMHIPPSANTEGYNDDTISAGIIASLRQIGLTVASKTIPVTRVVIDSAEQTPEKN
jgi:uncharacterized protein (TIGR03435 family)